MSVQGNGPPKQNPQVPPRDASTPAGLAGPGAAGGAGTSNTLKLIRWLQQTEIFRIEKRNFLNNRQT